MIKRIISAIILIPLLFFIIIKGGIYIYIAGTICSIIGLYEYFKVFKKEESRLLEYPCYALSIFMNTLLLIPNLNHSYIYLNTIYLLILVGAFYLIINKSSLQDIMISLLGFVYIPFFLSHINLISLSGSQYIWLVFIFAWVTDTFAYFSGTFYGKTKLIPDISPKKTLEGAIGGVVGTTVFTFVFAIFIGDYNPLYFIPLAIFASIVSQLGDLFASAIKRKYGIKDYGNIIPGHGGFLDRFDSILFIAPITYYGLVLIEFLKI